MKEKKKSAKKGRIGSSFDKFLKDDGIYEDVTTRAIKRVIARQSTARITATPRNARVRRDPHR